MSADIVLKNLCLYKEATKKLSPLFFKKIFDVDHFLKVCIEFVTILLLYYA